MGKRYNFVKKELPLVLLAENNRGTQWDYDQLVDELDGLTAAIHSLNISLHLYGGTFEWRLRSTLGSDSTYVVSQEWIDNLLDDAPTTDAWITEFGQNEYKAALDMVCKGMDAEEPDKNDREAWLRWKFTFGMYDAMRRVLYAYADQIDDAWIARREFIEMLSVVLEWNKKHALQYYVEVVPFKNPCYSCDRMPLKGFDLLPELFGIDGGAIE